jgi:hypothetical protein
MGTGAGGRTGSRGAELIRRDGRVAGAGRIATFRDDAEAFATGLGDLAARTGADFFATPTAAAAATTFRAGLTALAGLAAFFAGLFFDACLAT